MFHTTVAFNQIVQINRLISIDYVSLYVLVEIHLPQQDKNQSAKMIVTSNLRISCNGRILFNLQSSSVEGNGGSLPPFQTNP